MDRSKTRFAFTVPALTALVVGSLSASVVASSRCDGLVGCERKFCEIETQIDYAEKQANADKVAGLKKALSEARDHCTDDSLRQELKDDIEESRSDLLDYQEDLDEARADGDEEKVAKYQKKIADEITELEALQKALSEF